MNRRFLLNCKVLHVYPQSVHYPACPQCYSKLYKDLQQTSFQCLKCRETYKKPQQRYRLRLSVCDGNSTGEVTVFGSHLDAIIGSSANSLHSYMNEGMQYEFPMEDLLASALSQCLVAASFIFGFKLSTAKDLGPSPDLATLLQHAPVSSGTTLSSTQYSGPSLVAWQIFTPDGFPPKTTVSQHLRFLVKLHQNGQTPENISVRNDDSVDNLSGQKSFLSSLVELEDSRLDSSDFRLSQSKGRSGRSLALSCESTLNSSEKSETSRNLSGDQTRDVDCKESDWEQRQERYVICAHDMSNLESSQTKEPSGGGDQNPRVFTDSIEINRNNSMDTNQPVGIADISGLNATKSDVTLDLPYVSSQTEAKDTERPSYSQQHGHQDFSDDSELENYQYSKVETGRECFLTRKSLYPTNYSEPLIEDSPEKESQDQRRIPRDILESDSESSQENTQKQNQRYYEMYNYSSARQPKVNWAEFCRENEDSESFRIISTEDLQRLQRNQDDSENDDNEDDTFENDVSDRSFDEKISRINQMVSRMAETFSQTFPEYQDSEKEKSRCTVHVTDKKDIHGPSLNRNCETDLDETVDILESAPSRHNVPKTKSHNVLARNRSSVVSAVTENNDDTMDISRQDEIRDKRVEYHHQNEPKDAEISAEGRSDDETETSEVILDLPNSENNCDINTGRSTRQKDSSTSENHTNHDFDDGDDSVLLLANSEPPIQPTSRNNTTEKSIGQKDYSTSEDHTNHDFDDGDDSVFLLANSEPVFQPTLRSNTAEKSFIQKDSSTSEDHTNHGFDDGDDSVFLLANSEPNVAPPSSNNHTNSEYDRSIQLPRAASERTLERTMSQVELASRCNNSKGSVTAVPEYVEGSEQNEWTEMPYSEGIEDVLHDMSEFSFILDQKKEQNITKDTTQGNQKEIGGHGNISEERDSKDSKRKADESNTSKSKAANNNASNCSKTVQVKADQKTKQDQKLQFIPKTTKSNSEANRTKISVNKVHPKQNLELSSTVTSSHAVPSEKEEVEKCSGSTFGSGQVTCLHISPPNSKPTEHISENQVKAKSKETVHKGGECSDLTHEQWTEIPYSEELDLVLTPVTNTVDSNISVEAQDREKDFSADRSISNSRENATKACQNIAHNQTMDAVKVKDHNSQRSNEKLGIYCSMEQSQSFESSPYTSLNGSLDLFDGSADLFSSSDVYDEDEEEAKDIQNEMEHGTDTRPDSEAMANTCTRRSTERNDKTQNDQRTEKLRRTLRKSEMNLIKRASEVKTQASGVANPVKKRLKSVVFCHNLYTEKSIDVIDTKMAETPSPQLLTTRRKSNLKSSSTPIETVPKRRKTQSTDQGNSPKEDLPHSEELFSPSPISASSFQHNLELETPERKSLGDIIPSSVGRPLLQRAILGAMSSNLTRDRNSNASDQSVCLFSSSQSSVENSPLENQSQEKFRRKSSVQTSDDEAFNQSESLFASSSELFSDSSCFSPTQPSDVELCKKLSYK